MQTSDLSLRSPALAVLRYLLPLILAISAASSRAITEKEKNPSPPTVVISGNVKMPGRYWFSSGMKVSDLILRAGGFAGQAAPRTTVTRTTADGRTTIFAVDVLPFTPNHRKPDPSFVLQADDIVFIPPPK